MKGNLTLYEFEDILLRTKNRKNVLLALKKIIPLDEVIIRTTLRSFILAVRGKEANVDSTVNQMMEYAKQIPIEEILNQDERCQLFMESLNNLSSTLGISVCGANKYDAIYMCDDILNMSPCCV